MDLAQMRKVNEMARTLRQHGFASDAQAAAAQSETFFVNTNEHFYPHETRAAPEETQESQETEAPLQEEHSGSEVSLGILHDTYDRIEHLENTFQDKVEAVENDVAMIIEKVNELIQVMKSLEEKQDSVEAQLQHSTIQAPAPAPVAQPAEQVQSAPAQPMQAAPVAPTQVQQPAEAPTQPSQRTGDLRPGDVDLNNFFYYGQR